jgi:FixJ family two-component response regulator
VVQVALGRIMPDAKEKQNLRERFESLSAPEHEVVVMVVSGMLNKQIAAEIGTTENTVKVHRSRAMDKMQAKSVPHLVKMVETLQIPHWPRELSHSSIRLSVTAALNGEGPDSG